MGQALIPSRVIASNIAEDMGNLTNEWRALKKLALAYKEINLFLAPRVNVQSCIVPADHQVELPCDFIYSTKISIGRNGKFVTLDLNKNLRKSNLVLPDSQVEQQCNGLLDGTIDPTLFLPFYNTFRGANYLGEIYGMGSGFHNNNWYNIENGVLEIGSMMLDIADEVCVEYKSDGVKEAYKLIPSELEKCIMYATKALLYEDSQPTKAAEFQAKYENQYKMIKRMYAHRSPDYLAFVMHSSDSPTVRYPV
jgi:hypothetical protein